MLDVTVGVNMVGMALWVLRADTLAGQKEVSNRSAFIATLASFFIAEIGDKTQIATMALASTLSEPAGSGCGDHNGMLIANVSAVFLGDALRESCLSGR